MSDTRWSVVPATDEQIRDLMSKFTGDADQQIGVVWVMSLINRIQDDAMRISDARTRLDRLSSLVTPDRNMAEQIALYLDGQARNLDGSSMESLQLRRAAEWMRCLKPAPEEAPK